MNAPRRPPRIVVRARDPLLRSLIKERLAGLGEVSVRSGNGVALVEELDDDPHVTAREREVLALMAEGLANKEIADRLGVSVHTAKFHVESVMHKLSASNRAEAVKEGIRRGLIGI